MIKSI